MKKLPLPVLVGIVLLSSLILRLLPPEELTPHDSPPDVKGTQENEVQVDRVIDGDTIEISTGEKIRYIGINTPELQSRGGTECFAEEAKQRNKEIVEQKTVTLQKDVSETDRYGRLLRYVFVEGEMVNKTLVAEGYAHASAYPPDITYQEELSRLEAQARTNQQGLWHRDACSLKKEELQLDVLITQFDELLQRFIQ